MLKNLLGQLSSGSMILLTITFKLMMISQNISRRVVGNVLVNISPSNISLTMLSPARFHQNCQTLASGVSGQVMIWYSVCGRLRGPQGEEIIKTYITRPVAAAKRPLTDRNNGRNSTYNGRRLP